MIDFSVEIEGLDGLLDTFDNLSSELGNTLEETLISASKPMFNELENQAKLVDESFKFQKLEKTESSVKISLSLDSKTWVFKEYGSLHKAPTPFIRPILDSNIDGVVDNFSNILNSKIGSL